jgi:hypothetical protein
MKGKGKKNSYQDDSEGKLSRATFGLFDTEENEIDKKAKKNSDPQKSSI